MQYKRVFFMLKSDVLSRAFGTMKMEINNGRIKFSLSVQNLPQKSKFKLKLGSFADKTTAELSTFFSDEAGKIEFELSADLSSKIGNLPLDFPISNIDAAAVFDKSDNRLLFDFKNGKLDFGVPFISKLVPKPTVAEPFTPTIPQEAEQENNLKVAEIFKLPDETERDKVDENLFIIDPETEAEHDAHKEQLIDEPIHTLETADLTAADLTVSDDDFLSELSEFSPENSHGERAELFKKITGEFNSEMEEIINAASKVVKEIAELKQEGDVHTIEKQNDLFSEYPSEKPFAVQSKDVRWIRINPDDLIKLPISELTPDQQKFVYSSYEKYKHLIFGKYDQMGESYYIFGIPAVYDNNLRMSFFDLGFRQFKPSGADSLKNGVHGYWLMVD